MTDIQDVVTGALRDINQVPGTDDPSAMLSARTLEKLNNMAFGWKADGIDVLWNTAELTDAFPLDPMHIEGVQALLAVHIAGALNKPVPLIVAQTAKRGKERLHADYHMSDPQRVDSALLCLPSNQMYR